MLSIGQCFRSAIRKRFVNAPSPVDADADDPDRVAIQDHAVDDVGADQGALRDQYPRLKRSADSAGLQDSLDSFVRAASMSRVASDATASNPLARDDMMLGSRASTTVWSPSPRTTTLQGRSAPMLRSVSSARWANCGLQAPRMTYGSVSTSSSVSYTHLTLPTIYSV